MSKYMYSFFSLEKNEDKLKNSVCSILDSVSDEEKEKVIEYILEHYTEANPNYSRSDLVEFFKVNYCSGVYYDALKHGLTTENYVKLNNLKKDDWETADFLGEYVGTYFIEKVL